MTPDQTVPGPVDLESASVTPSTDASTSPDSSSELERLQRKLELVTEDKRRAGEKNSELNRRLQELEEALRATQAQVKDGQTAKLAESGEYKQLWEDAKQTNLDLERQLADMRQQLEAERTARSQETLKSRALQDISAAKALRPDQLLALLDHNLREKEGRPVVIDGGIEIPLPDYLERLRSPDSGWDHHFAPNGSKGMGTAPSRPTGATPPVNNPFATSPPNLTEIARLYREDRALHDKLKAEAVKG